MEIKEILNKFSTNVIEAANDAADEALTELFQKDKKRQLMLEI